MQTHEWEALLHGTTPGPWFANVGGFGRIESIGPISAGFSIGDGLDCDEDDAILAAHAPAAVAEVVRLRQAIEDEIRSLRAPLCSHMPEGDGIDEYLDEWEMQGYAAHILTRILEGDNHD